MIWPLLLAVVPPDPLCIILLDCPIPTVITIPSPPTVPQTTSASTTPTTGAAITTTTPTSNSATPTSTSLPPEVTAELSAALDELLVIFDI